MKPFSIHNPRFDQSRFIGEREQGNIQFIVKKLMDEIGGCVLPDIKLDSRVQSP